MDSVFLDLAQKGRLVPQSSDEDLASRLILFSRECFCAAENIARSSPTNGQGRPASLMCYLAVFNMTRALMAAKGYRLTADEAHSTIRQLTAHLLGRKFDRALGSWAQLAKRWDILMENTDMPDVMLRVPAMLKETRAILRGLGEVIRNESPACRVFFRRSVRGSVSPERTFRE